MNSMDKYINKVIQGDCLDKLKELEDNSVDSIVTDPPYELGFMGKSWDSTGIANNVEMWKECLRVLKPGGHLLSFGGTRTYHRMAVAIEDAGFEVRDMIEWLYGSGFPKSHDISKAIDKSMGAKREVIGKGHRTTASQSNTSHEYGFGEKTGGYFDITAPSTEEAKQWQGWGTALKPAHEPICMARKPLIEKTVAKNVLKYGTGGINIDESRVGTGDNTSRKVTTAGHFSSEQIEQRVNGGNTQGRFPANLIHDNSEEVRDVMMQDYQDPSRFFKSIIYQAKASKSERNKGCEAIDAQVRVRQGLAGEKKDTISSNFHPTVKPIALMEYLIKMVTPKGGIVLDPFAGSGSTLVAAKQNGFNYIGIEMTEEYIPIIEARLSSQLTEDKMKE